MAPNRTQRKADKGQIRRQKGGRRIAGSVATGRNKQVSLDDAALAKGVADGDRGALEAVFSAYGGAVKSMALRVLRNGTLAEDVVQDVFVDFWKSPEKFDPSRGSLRTFLLTIAHRRAVDLVRSETARSRREETAPWEESYEIEDEVWSKALSESVRSALADLGEDERRAIAMAYFGGLSYVEVARRLGAPEGTVKSRIRAGMKKLSVSLEGVA
jgi:RNA polymerase sigma-70 factor (ECF subfamily)